MAQEFEVTTDNEVNYTAKTLSSVRGTMTCHRLWGYLQCGQ